ncbi:Dabb family protein [Anatilimnocola floriformis]|uniref:Dabb family protein n=1 Tax=Anatilimnocola floriformis TaxID=2948575 RepID=UPI0020C27CD7|nr:Dabb family protein [Anatilimnocola floriformis]
MNSKSIAAVIFAAVLFSLAVWQMGASQESKGPEAKSKVLRHVVMYKFKDEIAKPQIQEVIDAFAGLPKKIDGIVAFEHGPNVSPEGKSEGLTYCFVVSFKDEAARDAYLKHPAHDDYVKVVKDRREKVVVFDYWADR